jgi:bacillithiol biosynthesis cysteine-adding enzyme BshC
VQFNSTGTPSSESSLRIPVDVRRFPWIRRFAVDYAYDFSALAPFFAGDPASPAAWSETIARTRAHDRRRGEIASVVAAQQMRRRAPARAIDAARQLADPRTVAILTGQQAGLFGGPLFTLLKALTALKLAERTSRDHHVPAVAVFWIDAEDHDWEEVRSCTVFDDQLTPRRITLPTRVAEHAPVETVRLDESIIAALDELERVLPPTEFRGALVAQLRNAYSPGTGMADAFGRWLEQILGERGLIVFNAADPAAKPLVSGVFARELATPGETSRLAAIAGADLVSRGYHAQVQPLEHSAAMFHLEGGRRAIRHQDGRLFVGDTAYTPAALARRAVEQPSDFSPNVLLRPIVQDTLFPTLCYVSGPNELAYLGQLRGVYAHFGVPMPLVHPRATATLLDSAAVRFLTRYKPPLEALQPQDEAALNVLLSAEIPQVVEDSFAEACRATDSVMAQLIRTMPALDPTLERAGQATLVRMQHDLDTLHAKMIQAAKRRDETLRRQFIRTRALAFPDGHAQERTIGFVSFLDQYGPALVERLDQELGLDMGRHWIVTI